MRYDTMKEFNVDSKAECDQLSEIVESCDIFLSSELNNYTLHSCDNVALHVNKYVVS